MQLGWSPESSKGGGYQACECTQRSQLFDAKRSNRQTTIPALFLHYTNLVEVTSFPFEYKECQSSEKNK